MKKNIQTTTYVAVRKGYRLDNLGSSNLVIVDKNPKYETL